MVSPGTATGQGASTEINPPSGIDGSGNQYDDYLTDPALGQVRVFETAVDTGLDELNNELRIHTWGNERCCLPRGTTGAHVCTVNVAGTAVRPPIQKRPPPDGGPGP